VSLNQRKAETLYSNSQKGKNSFPQTPFFFALLLFGLRLIFLRGYKIKGWWVGLVFYSSF
ncbi:MAG: hypothetical protein WCX66_04735, partial [archaeon]